ncbi:hypothetical protein CO661_12045 [Sinorhizobium fredii]|uniref:Winged helix domain-containing protein n=1 Tax=Rhizobium fredii TaxID=380 RepID=A0A2A6LZ05_RHIFR|nr:hypothetical protein [Sinorhizobium fredii]PDT47466.1 hypothetical protein CO661_12045 [Sinorhizobium fredii]
MTKAGRAQLSLRVQILDDKEEPVGLPITVVGREAWALNHLVSAGERGCTPIDQPGPRWSHYTWKLRGYGFAIETIHEKHGGPFPGTHARYRLGSKVSVLTGTPGEAA